MHLRSIILIIKENGLLEKFQIQIFMKTFNRSRWLLSYEFKYFWILNDFEVIYTFQAAVGIELWTMSADILFDNILITSDEAAADEWASKTYDLKRKQIDKESVSLLTYCYLICYKFIRCVEDFVPQRVQIWYFNIHLSEMISSPIIFVLIRNLFGPEQCDIWIISLLGGLCIFSIVPFLYVFTFGIWAGDVMTMRYTNKIMFQIWLAQELELYF